MSSNAVGTERVSRVVGYEITPGDFSTVAPNLPQRISVIGEANETHQAALSTLPVQINSAKEAGELYGYGSPIHMALRILKPIFSDGVGGIPIIVSAQAKASGATSKKYTATVTGTVTETTTHTLVVAGRENLDGQAYDFVVSVGDTVTQIATKISDLLNNILGCPFIGTSALGVATAESKWKGLTAEDLKLAVNTNGNDAGLTYVVASTQAGTATPSITAALTAFGDQWNTLVVNTYGAVTAVMNSLELYNGAPSATTPTGRYTGIVMKPFIALTGSVLADPSSITDSRLDNVTIAICPAPNSDGHPLEAAANFGVLEAVTAQNTPHLDIAGQKLLDMPGKFGSTDIGVMADYSQRDAIVKKGCSTVDFISGKYRVQDFVTTYHPIGELVPQHRYVRNLLLDFNIRFSYHLLEEINVVDHVIVSDDGQVSADKIIKPKQWLGILNTFAESLEARALIVERAFMQNSIVVNLSTSNPSRLETRFDYKRSEVARIASTTVRAGFNFGV